MIVSRQWQGLQPAAWNFPRLPSCVGILSVLPRWFNRHLWHAQIVFVVSLRTTAIRRPVPDAKAIAIPWTYHARAGRGGAMQWK